MPPGLLDGVVFLAPPDIDACDGARGTPGVELTTIVPFVSARGVDSVHKRMIHAVAHTHDDVIPSGLPCRVMKMRRCSRAGSSGSYTCDLK